MSDAYDKGKSYEQHIAQLVRRKADKGALRNRGSHANWHRRSDIFTNLPIHIEAKHHENVRIKEWVEQAEAAKSYTQTAIVAFRIDEQDYACLQFDDLLNLFVQIADLQAEVEDLREPVSTVKFAPNVEGLKNTKPIKASNLKMNTAPAVEMKIERGAKVCKNGHLVDQYGYCLQTGCKYSRGYRAPKGKK